MIRKKHPEAFEVIRSKRHRYTTIWRVPIRVRFTVVNKDEIDLLYRNAHDKENLFVMKRVNTSTIKKVPATVVRRTFDNLFTACGNSCGDIPCKRGTIKLEEKDRAWE